MPDENKLANIEPETREETFLQDIADGTQTLIPAVRKEEFLRRIAANSGTLQQELTELSRVYPIPVPDDAGKFLTVEPDPVAPEKARFVISEVSGVPIPPPLDDVYLTSSNGQMVWLAVPGKTFFGAEFSQGFYADLGSIITSTVSGLLAGTSTSNVLSTDYNPLDDAAYDIATWEDMLAAFSTVPAVYILDMLNNQALRLTLDNVSSPNDPAVVASFPVLSPAPAVYVRVSFIVRYMPPDPSDPSDYPEFRMTCIAERIYPGITPNT